ncbi:MAG: 4Fe-4S binding protein [Treponema sp.]|nr:4Fe-4S binding protein [Spirochaetia bacterium]MDY2840061.1 4Fe-4S binding protein [Treponema sp.]MDY5124337.1 4Fe-4S binding protein [Treponema sp.]
MAFKINDSCVNCGSCEGDCPVGAISESGDKRVIDAAACISCGTCAAECPAGAISEE